MRAKDFIIENAQEILQTLNQKIDIAYNNAIKKHPEVNDIQTFYDWWKEDLNLWYSWFGNNRLISGDDHNVEDLINSANDTLNTLKKYT
jgi:hypothetical protein